MNIAVDLHMHSCLSPCGDELMTPNNIVNMALIKGLDIIAVCDHNTARHLPDVYKRQVLDSSTVITPSLPTFSMALEISSPMVSSAAEIAAT